MFMKPIGIPSSLRGASLAASLWLGVVASSGVMAAPAGYSEPSGSVRFEQYTASGGPGLVLWRLPTPGTSTFPGGSCKYLSVPGGTTMENRMVAIYMQSQSVGINYMLTYETTTCQVTSFGLEK